jgi:hypothetical protein
LLLKIVFWFSRKGYPQKTLIDALVENLLGSES